MTVNQISNELLEVMSGDDCCHMNEDGRIYFFTDDTPNSFTIEQDRRFIKAGAIPFDITEDCVFYNIPNFNTAMFVDRTRLIQKHLKCNFLHFHHDYVIFKGKNINDMDVKNLLNCGFAMSADCHATDSVVIGVNELMSIPDCEFSQMRYESYRCSVSFVDHRGNIVTHLHRSVLGAMINIKSVVQRAIISENDLDEDGIANIIRDINDDNYREVANNWGVTVQLNEHWS